MKALAVSTPQRSVALPDVPTMMDSGLPSRLDVYTIRLFIAVAEEGSIARAAEREGIAASALSRRLSDLEHPAQPGGGAHLPGRSCRPLTLAIHRARPGSEVTESSHRSRARKLSAGRKAYARMSGRRSSVTWAHTALSGFRMRWLQGQVHADGTRSSGPEATFMTLLGPSEPVHGDAQAAPRAGAWTTVHARR